MTGRRSALMVSAGLALATSVACGGVDRPSPDDTTSPGSLPDEVADRLQWLPPALPPELALHDGRLLVTGGLGWQQGDDHLAIPVTDLLVDLATGEVRDLAPPESDGPVEVLEATADRDGFVVTGVACAEAYAFPLDDRSCTPGTPVAFRLDGAAGTWTALPFPGGTAAPLLRTWLADGADGTVVAITTSERPPGDRRVDRVAVLTGDRWRDIGELAPGRIVARPCVTADTVFVLSQAEGGPAPAALPATPDAATAPSGLVLRAMPLDGGAVADMPLPALDGSYGSVGSTLACDRAGPYVTSSSAHPGESLELLALRDGTWQAVSGEWGQGLPEEMSSTGHGIVLTVHSGGGASAYSVATEGLSARRLDAATTYVLEDPRSGDIAAVGPVLISGPADGPVPPAGPITIATVPFDG